MHTQPHAGSQLHAMQQQQQQQAAALALDTNFARTSAFAAIHHPHHQQTAQPTTTATSNNGALLLSQQMQSAQQQQHQHSQQSHHGHSSSSASHAAYNAALASQLNASNFASPSMGSDDGTILFIGDLSRTVKEEELHLLFSPFGTVTAIDIKRDKLTQNNLGYGFVAFRDRNEAQAAKKALNGFELNSRKIRIGWAQKNTTLFVGDLDGTISSDDLVRVFEVFGPIVTEESFVKEPSRKYGFVRFASREDAERAKADMNHKVLGSRAIRIGWGDSNFEKHCVHIQFDPHACHLQTGLNVNSIFTEQFFLDSFAPFAKVHDTAIVNISLPKHSHTKKLKGFAFIHFEENEQGERAAVLALQTLTNHVDASPQMQAVGAGANIPASNPMTYVHHLQQSFSPRQGAGHHAPPSATPNNNTQQHVLGGIPVKYSFGKRQIFSRHKRANENHAAALAANQGLQSMHSNMALMLQGMNTGYTGGADHGAANGTTRGGQHGGRSGSAGMHRYHRNGGTNGGGHHQHHDHGGRSGGYSQGGSATPSYGGNASNYFSHQSNGVQSQSNHQSAYGGSSSTSAQSRYHTNPISQSAAASYASNSSLQQQQHHASNEHGAQSTTTQAQHAAAAQAQAAEATRWMIASLAAQQYGQGASPLSVQQVQQAYQQIQQQATQAAASPTQSAAFLHGGSQEIAAAATGGNEVGDAATSLASAANAFFNAQQQLYFSQISQQAGQNALQQQQQQSSLVSPTGLQSQSAVGVSGLQNLNTLSHPSPSSMEQLMSEMTKLGIGMPPSPQNATNGQQQQQYYR